jgi:uncharacterized damage-inducible protein DinB
MSKPGGASDRQHKIYGGGIVKIALQEFLTAWNRETIATLALFDALPRDKYEMRAEPGGRSLGELAWHLAEIDGYITAGIAKGDFKLAEKPRHMDRPRRVEDLAAAFRLVHEDAVARLSALDDADLDRQVVNRAGDLRTIRDLLWHQLLLHAVHHRGQLTVLCRLAGGVPPEIFGRTREKTPARA